MLSNEELKPTQPKIDWKQAASVISSAQIVEAVESGEYVGFCAACGAEHDGIEPDAEHYLCEAVMLALYLALSIWVSICFSRRCLRVNG